ncbi:MAG: hypothetical protein L0206_16715, partial [Actinobacteria bacterium]|nr:hypothetical protein [Actinomycetota bacterium]
YAFCRIVDPEPGTWFLRAERVGGEGVFQLLATTIGGDYPECGNGIHEPGEECDDTDVATCPTGCSQDCTCLQCSSDLDVREIELWPKLFLFAALGDGFGTYADLDPSIEGVRIELIDAKQSAPIDVPSDDPGWVIVNPERGRFRWRGTPESPIRRLDLRTSPKRRNRWRLTVKGKDVPGTETIDYATLTVRVVVGSRCAERRFHVERRPGISRE